MPISGRTAGNLANLLAKNDPVTFQIQDLKLPHAPTRALDNKCRLQLFIFLNLPKIMSVVKPEFFFRLLITATPNAGSLDFFIASRLLNQNVSRWSVLVSVWDLLLPQPHMPSTWTRVPFRPRSVLIMNDNNLGGVKLARKALVICTKR